MPELKFIQVETKASLIIFDLDGTLVEFPFEYLFSTAERLLGSLSLPLVSREEIESCFADFDFFRFIEEVHRDRFAAELDKILTSTPFPPSSAFPDAQECLSSLKNKGFTLALATARVDTSEELTRQLASTGLVDSFSYIATRCNVSDDWSDKKGQMEEICRALEFQPSESVVVSDIPPDILSAKAMGCALTVAMTTGGTRAEVLLRAEPDLLCNSLVEFESCVLKV